MRRRSHGWDTASAHGLSGCPAYGLLVHGLSREISSARAAPPATRPCSRQATRVRASAAWTPSRPQRHAFCPRVGTPSATRRHHAMVPRAAGQIPAVERSAGPGAAGAGLGAVGLGTVGLSPLRTPMGQRPGRGRQKPPPTSYAGLITCLRCDNVFASWDRRQNRLCDACRQTIEQQPSDEPTHPIARSRRLPPRGPDDR